MNILLENMLKAAEPGQVAGLSRFFKTGPGQYGEGDKFLGIKVPVTREIVKQYWKDLTFEDLTDCINSEYHEVRLAALLSLVQIFKHAKKDQATKKQCVDFYLSHTSRINNWDLVDLSCYEILGPWLLESPSNSDRIPTKLASASSLGRVREGEGEAEEDSPSMQFLRSGIDRNLLYSLAENGRTIWEQRIGIVTTMAFIRKGQLDDTYAIADIFLAKPAPLHDLLQKAAGWLLREAGKRDPQRLKDWLEPRCKAMPRTMLRYAIEKFDACERQHYLEK